MKIELDILSIQVLEMNDSSDLVTLNIALPDPCWPYKANELSMSFRAATGTGASYAEDYFGIKPHVTKVKSSKIPFVQSHDLSKDR